MTPRLSLILPAALLLVGCPQTPDKETGDTAANACTAPTVDPIEEQTIEYKDDATVSAKVTPCADSDTLTYAWVMDSTPLDSDQDTSILSGGDSADVSWKPDSVGTYVLTLVVTDQDGGVSQIVYAVVNVVSGNEPPIADCGDNKTAVAGDRVDLDGSASSDPEGAEITYDWSVASSPDCSEVEHDDVFNGDKAVASLVPDCAGTYVLSLVVSDSENFSEADYCSVTVASDNQAPIADAGDSSTLSPCTPPDFHLDGWGSYDPDGDAVTYQWTLLSAPSGSAGYFSSDDTAADPYFHWDIPGEYTFELQVCDEQQCSAPDVVTYTFVDESENSPPTANAGDDQTVTQEPDCETASYVWTCEDCPADSVTIDGTASIDETDGDELDFYWTESTGEVTVAAPMSPTTEVSLPSFAATYNTAISKSWTVNLAVSDCSESDSDSVTITYTCTGSY